jgi:hypothetical protein
LVLLWQLTGKSSSKSERSREKINMPDRYTIPRLSDTSRIVLSYGPLEMDARQLTVLALAVILSVDLWPWLAFLPLALHWLCVIVISISLLPLGWLQPAGAPLEVWGIRLLRYYLLPKRYLWHRVVPEAVAAEAGKKKRSVLL